MIYVKTGKGPSVRIFASLSFSSFFLHNLFVNLLTLVLLFGVLTKINAAITVQLLVSLFAPNGIIHIGGAGTVNDSLSIGDVVVPKEVGFLGNWKWLVQAIIKIQTSNNVFSFVFFFLL